MSNLMEIEAALKELPLQDAQVIAQWLQRYLDQQASIRVSMRRPRHRSACPIMWRAGA
jgi:hypothetical protein